MRGLQGRKRAFRSAKLAPANSTFTVEIRFVLLLFILKLPVNGQKVAKYQSLNEYRKDILLNAPKCLLLQAMPRSWGYCDACY